MTEETPPLGELILYQTVDGRTRVECRFAKKFLQVRREGPRQVRRTDWETRLDDFLTFNERAQHQPLEHAAKALPKIHSMKPRPES